MVAFPVSSSWSSPSTSFSGCLVWEWSLCPSGFCLILTCTCRRCQTRGRTTSWEPTSYLPVNSILFGVCVCNVIHSVGALVTLMGFLGCCGAWKESPWMLGSVGFLLFSGQKQTFIFSFLLSSLSSSLER